MAINFQGFRQNFKLDLLREPYIWIVSAVVFFITQQVLATAITVLVVALFIALLKTAGARIETGKLVLVGVLQSVIAFVLVSLNIAFLKSAVFSFGLLSLDLVSVLIGTFVLTRVFKEVSYPEGLTIEVIMEVITGVILTTVVKAVSLGAIPLFSMV